MSNPMDDHYEPLYDGLKYPGHGYPDRRVMRLQPMQPFGRMMVEQGYGKRTNLLYDAAAVDVVTGTPIWQYARDSICEPRGNDIDATQMQITLCSPAAIPRTIAELGADIENQTGEFTNAGMFGQDYPGTAHGITWPPFTAILKWGTGGTRAHAFIDWVQGATINITASSLDLRAAVAPDAANTPGDNTSGLYTLSGFVSPGWPRPGSAQRTIYLGAVDDTDESDIFATPPFAAEMTVIGSTVGAPVLSAGYLRFWQSPDGTNPVGDYFFNGNQPIAFRVPNGGMYFSIVNGSGSPMNFAACAKLAI